MPIRPIFTITPKINSTTAQIERIKAVVEHSSVLPGLEFHLRHRATVEAVYSSTSIEGNPLSKREVQNILAGKIVHASEYAITEVVNYKRALDWLRKKIQHDRTITIRDILELHKLTTKGLLDTRKTGVFRPGPVYVVDEIKGKEIIRYTGLKSEQVPRLVDELLVWLDQQSNSDLHALIVAGLLHYIFVSIHPFSDGNGRVTRLLSLWYLRRSGYGFRETLIPDSYYIQHKLEYFTALDRGKTFPSRIKADTTPFLEFFMQGILTVAENLKHDVMVATGGQQKVPIRLSRAEMSLMDFTHQFGSITTNDAVDVLGTPKRTAQRRLEDLIRKGLLIAGGKGRATKYTLAFGKEMGYIGD